MKTPAFLSAPGDWFRRHKRETRPVVAVIFLSSLAVILLLSARLALRLVRTGSTRPCSETCNARNRKPPVFPKIPPPPFAQK